MCHLKTCSDEKVSTTPKVLIDRYRDGQTNAVSLLHQLAQVLQFHLEIRETTGNLPGFYFAFCVVIDGVEYKTGMGLTKKEARLKASVLALEDFLPTLETLNSGLPEASDVPPPLPVKEEPSISDTPHCRAIHERRSSVNNQIPQAVRDQLVKLMNSHSEFSACAGTMAAFILQTSSGYEVVSLGTGNFNTKESASTCGRIVHDSHEVVSARRSLMRFLYRHLLMFFSKTANLTQKSIFQQSSSSGLLCLKSGITLHLYVNRLPKGAAIPSQLRLNPRSISAWQVNNDISLHLSVEGKVFSVFSSTFDQSAPRVVSMSATDKLTQWQVLGYQGALLSHFIEPVYVQSILIGDSDCSDIRGMEISMNQRVEGITPQLPMFYCMVRPQIYLVPSVATTSSNSSQLTYGINWSEGDSSLEVVDGLEGKTVEESPFKSGPALASRLCKAAMLHRFKLVAKEAQRQELLATSSYREAKKMAKPYQEAKNVLRAYLLQQGFGSWPTKLSGSEEMLGSTVINHRQHVGLQKLSALAGITHSSLGPYKKYKFIQDETSGESALVCSCFRILENLELTCAVGQLVYETIQAHQKVFHTGSGCLLFLAGVWSRVALECLHKGISVSNIISAMSEGLDICFNVCKSVSISTEGLGGGQSQNSTSTPHDLQVSKKPAVEWSQASNGLTGKTKDTLRTLNPGGQRKIKLSRHFCDENIFTESEDPPPKLLDIAHIADGLSHGCVDAMNLVVKASRIQSNNMQQGTSCSTFDVTKVLTCVLPGLTEEQACVTPGCILLLSTEQASVAHHLKGQLLKIVLINGDLSFAYRHLGFKRQTGMQSVSEDTDLLSSNKEEEWMEKVLTILLNLEVNLILVSGLVSAKVIQCCSRHHILALEKVNVSVLKALADASGAVPVTYATQLTKHCVGAGVKEEIWKDLSSYERKPSIAVNISTGRNSDLVTAILTSCVEGKLLALEDQFWACAYRLHHALKDRALLPGAGMTEILCVQHLQKEAMRDCVQQNETGGGCNPYRSVVLHLMADGFMDYISTVIVNTGKMSKVQAWTVVSQQLCDYSQSLSNAEEFSQLFLGGEKEDTVISSPMKSTYASSAKTYDCLSVKQEAWRKALDLVFLVLQTDAEVITGINQKTEAAERNLMLL
ncbi:Bardet-Biedl syndrome 12 protein-like [Cheilinus undulatus]|uniref:Bardet-Biedl syndrome 12 protein-like n=1 Tax=Cheilinus undulatus TaxID=241271 RepID=UPI001BD3990A|nr:Bardet-Biedl syndrome 12 protein-like [Cheilinus undulatus]